MTKDQTHNFLRTVYAEWILTNQNAPAKGLMFFNYINQQDYFSQLKFGRVSPYQMTAIWVRDWSGE